MYFETAPVLICGMLLRGKRQFPFIGLLVRTQRRSRKAFPSRGRWIPKCADWAFWKTDEVVCEAESQPSNGCYAAYTSSVSLLG